MGVPSFPPPIGGVKGLSAAQAAQAFPGMNIPRAIPQPGINYPVDVTNRFAFTPFAVPLANSATYDPSKASYNPAQAGTAEKPTSTPVAAPAPLKQPLKHLVPTAVDPPKSPPKKTLP